MPKNFGARLRQRREQQQITLATIAEQTKIKVSLLEGLEQGDVSHWPMGIFRRAFLRAYAQAIGLEPAVVLHEFLTLYPDPIDVVSLTSTDVPSDAASQLAKPPTAPSVSGRFRSWIPVQRTGRRRRQARFCGRASAFGRASTLGRSSTFGRCSAIHRAPNGRTNAVRTRSSCGGGAVYRAQPSRSTKRDGISAGGGGPHPRRRRSHHLGVGPADRRIEARAGAWIFRQGAGAAAERDTRRRQCHGCGVPVGANVRRRWPRAHQRRLGGAVDDARRMRRSACD